MAVRFNELELLARTYSSGRCLSEADRFSLSRTHVTYGGIPANVEAPAAAPKSPKSTKLPDTIDTPKPAPKPIPKPNTGLGGEEMSYGAFFKTIGLPNPRGRNITNAQLALDRANELDMTGWEYDSIKFKFYQKPPTE